jgi:hypothetical protein
MRRLITYCTAGVAYAGGQFTSEGGTRYRARLDSQPEYIISIDRNEAKEQESLTLLGLEHPLIRQLVERDRNLDAANRGLIGRFPGSEGTKGVLTFWHIQIHGVGGQFHQRVVPLGLDEYGERCRVVEHCADSIRDLDQAERGIMQLDERQRLARTVLPEMLRRELSHKGLLSDGASFSSKLLAWIEIAPTCNGRL